MEERFWSKVNKTETCWLWTASKFSNGYGKCWNEKGRLAHRVAWLLSGKTIPEGYVIRHKCRNRYCVNPEHLETGTHAENMADMIRDGTDNRGEKSTSAKLTEQQVREIRARHTENQRLLGEEFGVDSRTINKIILRRSWAHLE